MKVEIFKHCLAKLQRFYSYISYIQIVLFFVALFGRERYYYKQALKYDVDSLVKF